MPSLVVNTPSLDSLTAHFPLTFPVPTPTTHPDLVSTKDILREEDLLRNPFSLRHWWSAIQNVKEASAAQQKIEGPSDLRPEVAALLGPLASPIACKSLQRLTYLYEAALVQFPISFKLWKSYLQTRMSFVLGRLIVRKKAGGRKKFPEMGEALEDEKEDVEQWEGGLDGIVGWQEWKALVATFERALMWLPKVCRANNIVMNSIPDNEDSDASDLAAIRIYLQPSFLSPAHLTHARTPHLRSRPSHSPTFPTYPNMGSLSSMV